MKMSNFVFLLVLKKMRFTHCITDGTDGRSQLRQDCVSPYLYAQFGIPNFFMLRIYMAASRCVCRQKPEPVCDASRRYRRRKAVTGHSSDRSQFEEPIVRHQKLSTRSRFIQFHMTVRFSFSILSTSLCNTAVFVYGYEIETTNPSVCYMHCYTQIH